MQIIDEILELAKVFEPALRDANETESVSFVLTLENGKWGCSVSYGRVGDTKYKLTVKDKGSPEEALADAHARLTRIAKEKHSWLGQILEKFGGRLKAVK